MTVSTTWVKPVLKKCGIAVLTAAFWLIVWHLLSVHVNQVLLLPSPLQVWETWCRLMRDPTFWETVGMSIYRICCGFIAALITGTALAVFTARIAVLRTALAPVLYIVRAAPVASFIILTLVWIPRGEVPAFTSFLMVLPIVWVNVEQGIRQTDTRLLEMAAVYKFSFVKKLRRIYLPSVKPYWLSAAANGLGFAWKAGVAAEVLSLPDLSIGRNLYYAKNYLETPEVFAWTATVVLLSLLLEWSLLFITKRVKKRKGVVVRDNL